MKNIVLCCDGTWNRFGVTNTNVGKLCMTLVRSDKQIVYYDPGVGTIGSPGAWSKVRLWIDKRLDGAIATGLGANVIEGFDFLSRIYEPEDRIFLFGFSRGAYTVRALAGMLHMYGLSDRGNEQLTPHIWALYSARGDRDGERFHVADRFKLTFGRAVPIQFVGVWDTVSSAGWVWAPVKLPFTAKNPSVLQTRHAVAIDERRAFFRQNQFSRDQPDLKELWFAGAHADVGGGYPESESGLSQIALEWVMDEAETAGLLIDPTRKQRILGQAGSDSEFVKPNFQQPLHNSLTGGWHLLELIPRFRWRSDGKHAWGPNFWARRRIAPGAEVHPSVREKERVGYDPPNLRKANETKPV